MINRDINSVRIVFGMKRTASRSSIWTATHSFDYDLVPWIRLMTTRRTAAIVMPLSSSEVGRCGLHEERYPP